MLTDFANVKRYPLTRIIRKKLRPTISSGEKIVYFTVCYLNPLTAVDDFSGESGEFYNSEEQMVEIIAPNT